MLDGSLWRTLLLTLLLAVPGALAAPPAKTLDSAISLDGQPIADAALDPTGRFAIGLAHVDRLGNLLGQPTPREVYPCDFGSIQSPTSHSACRGLSHTSAVGATARGTQFAAATSFVVTGGITARYAVGGPSDVVSLWTNTRDTPEWEKRTPDNLMVVNVTLTPDASRVFAALAPPSTSPNGAGKLAAYYGNNGTVAWTYDVTNPTGQITSLDVSRDGRLLVVGTTAGLLFLDPAADRGTLLGAREMGGVTRARLSHDGSAVAATTATGIYYIPVRADRTPENLTWNAELGATTTALALSGDGRRFAVAAGTRIYFYGRSDNTLIAQPFGTAYDAGTTVSSLAYDAKAILLVASAGSQVLGFSQERNTPLWTLDPTSAGGLDAPLSKVLISESAERILVAGRTKMMPYATLTAARLAFAGGADREVAPATRLDVQAQVTNAGSLPDNFTLVIRRPVGWNGASDAGVRLLPDQTAAINFTVEVPVGQSPGSYGVTVEVHSKSLADAGRDSKLTTQSLTLRVPRTVALLVESEERLLLRQGQELLVPLTIRNQGNADGLVNLSADQQVSQGASWEVRFNREQVQVPAGGSASIEMSITAPRTAPSGDRNLVTIHAREGERVDATRTLTAYVDAQFAVQLSATNTSLAFEPGQTRVLTLTVQNTGNVEDTYNVTHLVTPPLAAAGWSATLDKEQITVPRGQSRFVTVTLRPTTADPQEASATFTVTSQGSLQTVDDSVTITLSRASATTPEKKSFLPDVAPLALLGVVALLALLRRGGRA